MHFQYFPGSHVDELELFNEKMQTAQEFMNQLTPGSIVAIDEIDVRGLDGSQRRINKPLIFTLF